MSFREYMSARKGGIIPLFFFAILQMLFAGDAYSETLQSDSLAEAFGTILSELADGDRPFASQDASLLIRSDVDGDPTRPLAAIIEKEGLRLLQGHSDFARVLVSANLEKRIPKKGDEIFRMLEMQGIDRVLEISASMRGRRLLLRARGVWLSGGTWLPAAASPMAYVEKTARVELEERPEWLVLTQPVESLTAVSRRWRFDTPLRVAGRVLDFASADMDDDGRLELLLLFSDRIEVYGSFNESFEFRYVKSLPADHRSEFPGRFVAGEIEICPDQLGELVIGAATNWLSGGISYGWENGKLEERTRLDGVPVACDSGGFALTHYRKGSHLIDGDVYGSQNSSREKPLDFEAALLSIGRTETGWIALAEDGRIQSSNRSINFDLKCGGHPALWKGEDGASIACSMASPMPDRDRLRFYSFAGESLEPGFESQALPGAIMALQGQTRNGVETVFSARYHASGNETSIDRFRR